MNLLSALAIFIGALGGLATWAFVGPAAGLGLQIWAAFVAWAAFYHSGGGSGSLAKNIPAHLFGGLIGLLALLATTRLAGGLGLPLAAGISVGIGAAVIVLAANLPALAQIPSSVYGFGCVAAYALLAGKLETLTAVSLVDNPWINVSVSMIIGALLGALSQALGKAMAARTATA